MTRNNPFKRIACATIVVLASGAGPAAADDAALNADELARWTTSLTRIRDMTPEWGVQGADAFKTSSDAGVPVFYLDVRKPEEWEKGVVQGAVTIRLTKLATETGLAELPKDKSTIIAIYCKSGHRSALALPLLHQLGYSNAISMKGGYEGWIEAGYPITGATGE